MDDLISRQDAINAISEWGLIDGLAEGQAIEILEDEEKVPSAQPEPHYDEWCTDCKEYDTDKHCCPRWNRVIRQTLKDAQPEPQWIPCSERLPEEGESVLLCDRYGDMTLGRLVRTDEGYKWDIYAWWNDIDDWNAWMPLPEPYKERREE